MVDKLSARLLRWAVIIVALIATAFPILWTVVLATRDSASAVAGDIFAPLSFEAFGTVWADSDFVGSLLMSMSVVIVTTGLTLLVTIPAAFALVRFQMRARTGLLVWLLIAYLLPDFLVAIPMYALLQSIGLYDTALGLAMAYQVFMTPLAMWLLLRFFADVPAELAEAAQVDGASHVQTLLRIYLPVVRPGIATTAVLVAVTVWNEVTIALALTLQNPTVPIAVAAYKGYAAIEWNQLAAASLLAMAPVVIFAVFAQRHIIRGLVAGAGK